MNFLSVYFMNYFISDKGSSRTSSAAHFPEIQPIPKQISHQSQYTDYSPEVSYHKCWEHNVNFS